MLYVDYQHVAYFVSDYYPDCFIFFSCCLISGIFLSYLVSRLKHSLFIFAASNF